MGLELHGWRGRCMGWHCGLDWRRFSTNINDNVYGVVMSNRFSTR